MNSSKLSVPQEQIDELKRIREARLEELKEKAKDIKLNPLPRSQSYKAVAISVDASLVPIQTDVVDGVAIRCADSDGVEYFQGVVLTDAPVSAIEKFMTDLFNKTPALRTLLEVMQVKSWEDLTDFNAKSTNLDKFVMEMLEWGSLVMLAKESSRAILLKDGLLRSTALSPREAKKESGTSSYLDNLRNFFEDNCRTHKNFFIGIAKSSSVLEKSKVLLRYIEGFKTHKGFYLKIPPGILKDTYGWRYLAKNVIWGDLYFVRVQPHPEGRVMTIEVPHFLESQLDSILKILAAFPLRSLPDRFRGLPDPIAMAHENTTLIKNVGKTLQHEIMR